MIIDSWRHTYPYVLTSALYWTKNPNLLFMQKFLRLFWLPFAVWSSSFANRLIKERTDDELEFQWRSEIIFQFLKLQLCYIMCLCKHEQNDSFMLTSHCGTSSFYLKCKQWSLEFFRILQPFKNPFWLQRRFIRSMRKKITWSFLKLYVHTDRQKDKQKFYRSSEVCNLSIFTHTQKT